MKIVAYQCVYGCSSLEFSSKVNHQIQKGWQPFGAVCVSSCFDSDCCCTYVTYAQAMVKYETPDQ